MQKLIITEWRIAITSSVVYLTVHLIIAYCTLIYGDYYLSQKEYIYSHKWPFVWN